MFYEGCTLDEIRTYRELEDETFDFGEGKMKIEGWYGSEDAYYEMCLSEECGDIEYKTNKKPKKKKKTKLNQYARKQICKKKLNKLYNYVWWAVGCRDKYKKRYYLSGKKKFAKKRTNKKIRRYKGNVANGSGYRKMYDYWWSILWNKLDKKRESDIISATNRGGKRRKSDSYYTPIPVIENLFEHYSLKGGSILEPSAGCGNFIKVARDLGYSSHITAIETDENEYDNLYKYSNEVIITDFLQWQPDREYKTIIGNPPYSLALEFIEKCFEIAGKDTEIVMLLRTAFLESKKRYSFWQRHPVSKLYVLSSRPSFCGKGTDATSYSWFIWDNGGTQEIKAI